MPPTRSRSQRKASNLANAAITLQSSGDPYSASTRLAAHRLAPSAGDQAGGANSLLNNRPLTVRERQLLDEERQEKEEREESAKRRKVHKRLDELERTNYRDAAVSLRLNAAESTRHDGEAFSIPNSALLALSGGDVELAKGHKQSAAVRRLLTYRRGFHALLEDAMSDETFVKAPFNYTQASAVIDKARRRRKRSNDHTNGSVVNGITLIAYNRRPLFCTICGQGGGASCARCGDRTCGSGACQETHNDARCDRPVR